MIDVYVPLPVMLAFASHALKFISQGLGSNPGEDTDVYRCIVPLRHGGTVNSRRAASPLVWLVEGVERSSGVFPQNWGGNEPNRTVTCMTLKVTASDRRHLALYHDEFCGPRFDPCLSVCGLAIHQNNHQARRRFIEWSQNDIAVVPDFHKRILFSDEAHFWLNGYVNKQNCRIWSEANPQVYVETPLHPEKLTVWCALWAGGIIGPYFFKNDESHNVTDNGDRYRAMITFIPELNNHDVQELWFQQDGATCHTARTTIDLLKDTFGDHLISRFGPVNWPPRSCDLTPLDYFLWSYVKSLVYADKPQTLDHLEDNIRRVIADIRPQMLENVIENWTSRLDYIRASRGSPMPEIIFKMIWNRFLEPGSAGRRPGQGRRRATTPNEDRYFVLTARRHRNMNATLLQQHLRSSTGTTVSTQTVRNRLHGVGLYARRPMECVRLRSRHRRDRSEWATEHVNWRRNGWSNVLFFNESCFSVHPDNRRIFIWRDHGSRNNPAFMHESVTFGYGGVLVYGSISIVGRTHLYIIRDISLTARRYRDEILRPIVVPYAAAIGDDFILMDYNCRPHRANLVEDFLFEEGIVRMEWPAYSPDMNPIEHVWDALGRRVSGRQPSPQTLQELERALLEEGDRIPQLVINSLIDSMPQRCSTLLAVRENHTPY
ncbi:transposable element Tcb2 transposase [Trichonephila clavipes]|nr:transposable element Tcb2 transposase [Trichonephila clavipes]